MIDLFALGLTHALLALAAWRLMGRADLDGTSRNDKRRARPASEPEAGDD
ncbi:MAG TPA: hypothetical protein VL100_13570 [Croceibacterium sp.]|nr:hypothetical protein [Croceibacterium sp.]